MSSIRLTITLTVLGAFCLLPLASAFAQSDDAYIKYRQRLMRSQIANIGAIFEILKSGLPYKQNIAGHAESILATTKLISVAFEKQVTEGMTDAEPTIWKKMNEFKEYEKKVEMASVELEKVSKAGGDVAAAAKALDNACNDCHEEFRKPEGESYKNKKK